MRSFSNMWYWIALAVVWSSASHWVVGVPYDSVLRAQRSGGQNAIDLHDLARINVNRLLYIGRVSGLWLLFLGCFVLTTLGILGFGFHIEFAQAVFLILFPLALVGLLNLSTARLIAQENSQGDVLYRRLRRHRLWVQLIGVFAIFITSLWGMYQNLAVSALG